MNLYKVNIVSSGVGWVDERSAYGEAADKDGETSIKYSLDGDCCVLTIKDGTVTQQRIGDQCVKITFIEGQSTLCEISNGGFCGSYEVFTQSLKFISGKGGYKLTLEYLNGSDREPITLTFTAIKNNLEIK